MTQASLPAKFGGTVIGTAILVAVLAVASGLALAVTDGSPRTRGAVAFAATTCLFGGVGAWVAARWPTKNPAIGVAQVLGAVSLRMFLPLAALGWLQTEGRGLREAGADRFLVIFYLLLLATDSLLHMLGSREIDGSRGKKSPD